MQVGSIYPTRLSGISDVTIDGPVDGEILSYDSASGKWINSTVPSGPTTSTWGEVLSNGNSSEGTNPLITNTATATLSLTSDSDSSSGGPYPATLAVNATSGNFLLASSAGVDIDHQTTANFSLQADDVPIINLSSTGAESGSTNFWVVGANGLSGTITTATNGDHGFQEGAVAGLMIADSGVPDGWRGYTQGPGNSVTDGNIVAFDGGSSQKVRPTTNLTDDDALLAVGKDLSVSGAISFSDNSTQRFGAIKDDFRGALNSVGNEIKNFDPGRVQGVYVSKCDRYILVTDVTADQLELYEMSIRGDANSATLLGSPLDVSFIPGFKESAWLDDDLNIIIVLLQNGTFVQYSVSDINDISTSDYVSDAQPLVGNFKDMHVKPGGREIYAINHSGGQHIERFLLEDYYTVTGMSHVESLDTSSLLMYLQGISWTDDGQTLYMAGDVTKQIVEAHAFEPWGIGSVNNFEIVNVIDVPTELVNLKSLFLNRYQSIIYLAAQDEGLYQWNIGLNVKAPVLWDGAVTSRNAVNEYDVYTSLEIANIPEITVSGSILTVTASIVINVKANIFTNTRFFVNAGVNFTIQGDAIGRAIVSTGTVDYIQGTGRISLSMIVIANQGTAKLFGTEIGDININNVSLQAWDLGTMTNQNVIIRGLNVTQLKGPLVFNNCAIVTISGFNNFFPVATVNLIEYSNTVDEVARLNITGCIGDIASPGSFIRVAPALRPAGNVLISTINVSADTLFDTSGSTGVFTAVTDVSVSATPINSVSSGTALVNGNAARFNITSGPNLYVNQLMVNAVANPLYSGAHIVTETDGVTWYEVHDVVFTATDSGTFTSASVAMDDIGTALSDNDQITLNTTVGSAYDGSSLVYGKVTDGFRVNLPYSGLTDSGTWSRKGLDQSAPCVLTEITPGFQKSTIEGFAQEHGYGVFTPVTDSVYTALDVGTLTVQSEERVKLIGDSASIYEIQAEEPTRYHVEITAWVSKSGATLRTYRVALSIDGVVPIYASAIYERVEATNNAIQVVIALETDVLVAGQTLQPMQAGQAHDDDLLYEDYTVRISSVQ